MVADVVCTTPSVVGVLTRALKETAHEETLMIRSEHRLFQSLFARSTWRLAMAGTLLVLLAGWHAAQPAGAATVVTYWTYQQSAKDILAATDASIKAFEKANPGVTVKSTVYRAYPPEKQ